MSKNVEAQICEQSKKVEYLKNSNRYRILDKILVLLLLSWYSFPDIYNSLRQILPQI